MNFEELFLEGKTFIEKELPSGKAFEVKDCFPPKIWNEEPVRDRRLFGKYFAYQIRLGRIPSVVQTADNPNARHNMYLKVNNYEK